MSSSSNQFTTPNFYGHQTSNSLGMGSLQNMTSRSPLSLARGGGTSSASFNSAVGGDRLSAHSSNNGYSNNSGSNNNNNGGRQSTVGMDLLQSSSGLVGNRNPLFSRDRGKLDSSLSPNAFDPSEFPSLGNRDNSAPNPSLTARSNYVGMVKQPAMESSEFTMSNEDFPALPGCKPSTAHDSTGSLVPHTGIMGGNNNNALGSSSASLVGTNGLANISLPAAKMNASQGLFSEATLSSSIGAQDRQQQQQQHQQLQQQQRGIITSQDGMVTNIPQSMVTDQFGMIGLLTFIRAAETDPNLVSLALGTDLTTLGLNLNSEINLYPTFAGPWAETPCRPQDIDYHVPQEYLTSTSIRDKLAPVKLNRYKDDVLFYMFYTNVGDVLQLAAAAELYHRDWRFHKDDRVWITRAPGMAPSEKTTTYERGTYYVFDVNNWRKVSKDFHLDYDKLEDRPTLPSNLSAAGVNSINRQNPSSTGAGSPAPIVTNGPMNPQSGMPSSAASQQQHSPSNQSQLSVSNNDVRS